MNISSFLVRRRKTIPVDHSLSFRHLTTGNCYRFYGQLGGLVCLSHLKYDQEDELLFIQHCQGFYIECRQNLVVLIEIGKHKL